MAALEPAAEAGAWVAPDPPDLPPGAAPPSSTFLALSADGVDGIGMGRLSADLASCSELIAWYMSKPTNEMNLYVRYGANAAMREHSEIWSQAAS